MEQVIEFDSNYTQFRNNVANLRKELSPMIELGDLRITNMTIFYKTNKEIDIDSINGDHLIGIQQNLIAKNFNVTKVQLSGVDNVPSSRFKNARILRAYFDGNDKKKKCFLIFRNGGIQIKGQKDATSGVLMSKAILNGIFGSEDDVVIEDIQIHLMNSSFNIPNYCFDLDILHEALVADDKIATLDREHHAAVNVSINYKNVKKVTVLFFRKGNIIITGGTDHMQLLSAYAYVGSFLGTRRHLLIPAELPQPILPRKRGRKPDSEKNKLYANLGI